MTTPLNPELRQLCLKLNAIDFVLKNASREAARTKIEQEREQVLQQLRYWSAEPVLQEIRFAVL